MTLECQTKEGDRARLRRTGLSVEELVKYVANDGAGATAVFVGTTRDSFQGKTVIHLEYESYEALAVKTLLSILQGARTRPVSSTQSVAPAFASAGPSSPFTRLAIDHLLGRCDVGQASIVIAASAPHRNEAFEVCEWALEQVKLRCQVWKREVYGRSLHAGDSVPSAPSPERSGPSPSWSWKANELG